MGKLISDKFAAWQEECEQRFQQLKANEEELNRIFIDIYGLQDELTPEVEDKDVTVRRADLTREIKSLLSYAVGCLFGRYSLDVDGLVYAGGEWDDSKYVTLKPVTDNVLPLCDEEYFGENDLVNRIVEFVRVVYGADTLEENLAFVASALGGKVSYYHDRSDLEADCVLHLSDGRYALIEFKLGSREIEEGAQHLLQIKQLVRTANASGKTNLREPDLLMVITGGELAYTRLDGVKIIPIGCLRD